MERPTSLVTARFNARITRYPRRHRVMPPYALPPDYTP